MKTFLNFKNWVNEGSGDIFKTKRNKPVIIDNPRKHPELAGEFFNLISIAYAEIGGHAKVKDEYDVFSDPNWTFWEGVDLHGTSDFDVILFGQKTSYGVKFSGVGHDGEKDSKKYYLEHKAEAMTKQGFYCEVSGKLAEILIDKYKVPIVEDEAEVEKVLAKPIKWIGKLEGKPGNGWYERPIGGYKHNKILVGRPKV